MTGKILVCFLQTTAYLVLLALTVQWEEEVAEEQNRGRGQSTGSLWRPAAAGGAPATLSAWLSQPWASPV